MVAAAGRAVGCSGQFAGSTDVTLDQVLGPLHNVAADAGGAPQRRTIGCNHMHCPVPPTLGFTPPLGTADRVHPSAVRRCTIPFAQPSVEAERW